jgi:hypothetical protein
MRQFPTLKDLTMRINSLFPRARQVESRSPVQPRPGEIPSELRSLNQEYIDAARTNDTSWFQEYLADDAVIVLGNGRRYRKPQFLALLNDEPIRFTSLVARDVTVRVFGATVQVDGDAIWELTDGYQGISRYIDTYVWRDGRWQVISGQITLLPQRAD